MKKYLFIIFVSFFVLTFKVEAASCDANDIKRLKEIADGVEINYQLLEPIVEETQVVNGMYKLTINGLNEEIFIFNETDKARYSLTEQPKDIFGGKKVFKIYANNCSQVLKKIVLTMPYYNVYSQYDECKDKNNKFLSVCQIWTDKVITFDEFNKKIKQQDESITDGRNSKYLIIGGIVAVVLTVALLLLLRRMKGVLK